MVTPAFAMTCPHCGRKLKCNAETAGRTAKCPGCANPILVSADGGVEPAKRPPKKAVPLDDDGGQWREPPALDPSPPPPSPPPLPWSTTPGEEPSPCIPPRNSTRTSPPTSRNGRGANRRWRKLNKAYEECDVERIKQILDRWRSSPEQVRGDDTSAQLVRTIREIAQARKRLAAIKTEIEELADVELSRLKRQVEEAAARGQDLLADMAGELDGRIAEARARLKAVSKVGARP
jgi:hypothetical protein